MVNEPGFGMILKSAGPDDVYRPPAPFSATGMGEYGEIIGDEKGVKNRAPQISLQLIMAAN